MKEDKNKTWANYAKISKIAKQFSLTPIKKHPGCYTYEKYTIDGNVKVEIDLTASGDSEIAVAKNIMEQMGKRILKLENSLIAEYNFIPE